jgi:hypothetical protein
MQQMDSLKASQDKEQVPPEILGVVAAERERLDEVWQHIEMAVPKLEALEAARDMEQMSDLITVERRRIDEVTRQLLRLPEDREKLDEANRQLQKISIAAVSDLISTERERIDEINRQLQTVVPQIQTLAAACDRDQMPAVVLHELGAEKERIDEVGRQLEKKVFPQIETLQATLDERTSDMLAVKQLLGMSDPNWDEENAWHKDGNNSILGQLRSVKVQQELLVQPHDSAGSKSHDAEQLSEMMQVSIERLEKDQQSRIDAITSMVKAVSGSEASLKESVAKEKERLDTVFPELRNLRSDFKELQTLCDRLESSSGSKQSFPSQALRQRLLRISDVDTES